MIIDVETDSFLQRVLNDTKYSIHFVYSIFYKSISSLLISDCAWSRASELTDSSVREHAQIYTIPIFSRDRYAEAQERAQRQEARVYK